MFICPAYQSIYPTKINPIGKGCPIVPSPIFSLMVIRMTRLVRVVILSYNIYTTANLQPFLLFEMYWKLLVASLYGHTFLNWLRSRWVFLITFLLGSVCSCRLMVWANRKYIWTLLTIDMQHDVSGTWYRQGKPHGINSTMSREYIWSNQTTHTKMGDLPSSIDC